ncbi:MAG: hypothetical protein WC615_00380 [Mucilaginibacter sp.]|uniref:hypothetical protein n=1 Tax=Mucilaginibacter sp. TaxID=1882438 RepID=UPI00356AC248
MLRSEINELENSVGAIINETSTANDISFQKRIAEQVTYVQKLCDDLKKKWTHELLSNAKEQVIKRYVQYHQAGIIQLADEVSRQIPASGFSEEEVEIMKNAYRQLTANLEQVLEFLRHRFYQYFDIDHKASIYHCTLLFLRFASFEHELIAYQNPSVDHSLIEVVLTSVHEVAAEGFVSGISYRQADQSVNLLRMTHQLLLCGTNTTTASLVHALYQQNLNTLHFFYWYQRYISLQISQAGAKNQQYDLVDEQLKSLTGVFVNPEKALQTELLSIDLLIIPWLQEQAGSSDQIKKGKSGFQLPLNLSVPQFALFIRIFYKTGCFPVENVAMIIRFFTEHFTTKKQPHISHKSFGRAFYNLDQSAAAVVRDFLQKMLSYLNKTYFP